MTYRMGWWGMPCFNALSPEQQHRLVTHGNVPIDYRAHLSGPCHAGAQVGIEVDDDEYPGPRFYCLSCAFDYLIECDKRHVVDGSEPCILNIMSDNSDPNAWWRTHDNVSELVRSLIDQSILTEPGDVADVYDKPWKYTPEWESHLAAKAAGDA